MYVSFLDYILSLLICVYFDLNRSGEERKNMGLIEL